MSLCRVSCDLFTMDHNGNKMNDLLVTFCVIYGTDYMIFCLYFIDKCFNMYTDLHHVYFMCV